MFHICTCTHVHAHTLPQGISFIQFNNFCQLLNSLDDFGVAMMMFTIAGTSVTQEEFARAAKVCIGTPLDSSVISTVFHIFDVDGRQSPLSNTHAHTLHLKVYMYIPPSHVPRLPLHACKASHLTAFCV